MVSLGSNRPTGTGDRGTGGPGRWFDTIAASPRPAVVDYAANGNRVELSGRVLANWAAKTANLLEVEGHGPGSRVLLDLPLDWKSLALVLGLARAGVDVVWAERDAAGRPAADLDSLEPGSIDLVVSGAPGDWADHPAELWAVSPGALDGGLTGSLDSSAAAGGEPGSGTSGRAVPPHALDYAAEVRLQADQCPLPLPGPDLPAVVAGWRDVTAGGPDVGASRSRLSHRERGLVVAAAGGRVDRTVARAVVGVWTAGHPVVLVPAREAGATGSPDQSVGAAAVARLVAAEQLGHPLTK